MNKKIMMSGLSIISALALLGGTAFAAFTTQATATGNTFSTGIEDLRISTDDSVYASTISNPFNHANITPGYNQQFIFYLKNFGADPIDINASFVGGATGLDDVLMTDFDCDNGANPSAFSVTAMKGGSVSLGSLNPGASTLCHITVNLPFSVDNSYSGGVQSVFDVHFDGTQQAL